MPSFPSVTLQPGDLEVIQDYLGKGYAHFTEPGMEAVRLLAETDGIKLEGTYSGKTMAALIEDAKRGELSKKVTLFWNTYNSVDFHDKIEGFDFHGLPGAYHAYFTTDDQPLEIRDP
jgi:D-cysteine desulfhydrase